MLKPLEGLCGPSRPPPADRGRADRHRCRGVAWSGAWGWILQDARVLQPVAH